MPSPLLDTKKTSKEVGKCSINKEYLVCPFLRSYYSRILKVFELAAEQGGVRSYIIYLLFINGRMIFHEIVEKTGMSPRHVNRVLQDLKQSRIIGIDHYGYWFLTE